MRTLRALTGAAAAGAFAVLITAAPAQAATDTYWLYTSDNCGIARFIDHGEGAPGGGPNDDYVEIYDACADRDGVRAWAWLDGTLLGSRYNGEGFSTTVIWDPFGNIPDGGFMGIEVCIVDGPNDMVGFNCESWNDFIEE
ncbi:hypothetical protein [Streptomyces millisiae]|uniref:Ricin B lectin domain-containing protein n=1 Tax=Streptomyces millisiae TaxID=3075542 RepID=A0ABU2LXK1_9ACTN|nr:hypothetical protein [Streptomyces sp. DSM 44918]MDT0322328.1 hypothetical protein [Streptomyces sp. DSM 44918]